MRRLLSVRRAWKSVRHETSAVLGCIISWSKGSFGSEAAESGQSAHGQKMYLQTERRSELGRLCCHQQFFCGDCIGGRKTLDEPESAGLPTVVFRLSHCRVAIAEQRLLDGTTQVLIACSDGPLSTVYAAAYSAENVDRTGNWISCNRHAACERLDVNEPEGVGAAWKDEDVRRGIAGC